MTLTIVVLNYNGKKHLRRCLKSIQKQTHKKIRTMIIDNASSDGSQKMVDEEFPEMELYPLAYNVGVSAGYNFGYARAKTKYVATIPNDVTLSENWAVEMEKGFKNNQVAITAGHIKNREAGPYYGDAGIGFTMDMLGNPVTQQRDTEILGTSAPMIDATKIETPYFEEMFYSGDEVYLGLQALTKGYTVKQCPAAKIFHYGKVSIGKNNKMAEYEGEKNRYLNLLLYYEPWTLIKATPFIILNMALTTIKAVIENNLTTRIKSYKWIVQNRQDILERRREIQGARVVKDWQIKHLVTNRLILYKQLTGGK